MRNGSSVLIHEMLMTFETVSLSPFLWEDTEAQRGEEICPGAHSWRGGKPAASIMEMLTASSW